MDPETAGIFIAIGQMVLGRPIHHGVYEALAILRHVACGQQVYSAVILESGCGASLTWLLQNGHEQYCVAVMNVLIDFLHFYLVIDDQSLMKALELMMSDEQNVAAVASKFVSAYVLRFPGSVVSLTELRLAKNNIALIRSDPV
jgi:hypothetical protein